MNLYSHIYMLVYREQRLGVALYGPYRCWCPYLMVLGLVKAAECLNWPKFSLLLSTYLYTRPFLPSYLIFLLCSGSVSIPLAWL